MIDPLSKLIHRNAGQHGPVMLMYHSVWSGKSKPTWPWAVSLQQFRDQLDFLSMEGYATPTMDELATNPQRWMGRTAVITFDDGYVDNLAACEELQKRGMCATWFIVSGSIGLIPKWITEDRPASRLLNAPELRNMQTSGMEIGSHTVSHVRLTDVDNTRLAQELSHSKETLEDLLGKAVSSFAYPYGAWDTRCQMAVEQAGYSAACTSRTGWALRDSNLFQMRRLTIFNTDSASTFARKLYWGRNDVRWRSLAGDTLNHFMKRRP